MKWYKDMWNYKWKRRQKPPHLSKEEIKILEKRWVEETMKNLKLKQNSKLLFLCCGIGTELIEFAKKGFKVVGLDYSKEALKILRKKLKDKNLTAKLIPKFFIKKNLGAKILEIISILKKSDFHLKSEIRKRKKIVFFLLS